MNKDNLRLCITALRDAAAAGADFSMEHFGTDCGTPLCVIGHLAVRRDLQQAFTLLPHGTGLVECETGVPFYLKEPLLQDFFGVTREAIAELFSESGCGGAATPEAAIAYLETFIDGDTVTPEQAITKSITYSIVVTLDYSADTMATLRALCEGSVDANHVHEFWGSERGRGDWRVHVRTQDA